jgi:hydroxyethylthiazole kinase-like uncharacterized protein yjeF
LGARVARFIVFRMTSGEWMLDRAQAQRVDRWAQDELGLPGDLLMENAGAAVARLGLDFAAQHELERAVVLCGPGNNGGDGLVAARHVHHRLPLDVLLLGDPAELRGDARRNLERVERLGIALRTIETAEDVAATLAAPPQPLVVDALFGIGLSRPLAGLARDVVLAIERADGPLLAVDVPSGLDCDSGAVLGAAVRASLTATFVATKRGFHHGEGKSRCGRVVVVPIGFPQEWARGRLAAPPGSD